MDIFRYQLDDGFEPFTEWLEGLKDRRAQGRIRARLYQLEAGNFGDCAAVGDGVSELRVHIGAGYRVYCGRWGNSVVLLLCGGDKSSQAGDIRRAKEMWSKWKRSQE